MPGQVKHLADDESFSAEVSGTEPVLLDFWADWCEPCKAMEPALEQIGDKYVGRLRVLKVDLDECPGTAARLRVFSIPTLIFLTDGEPAHRVRGAHSYEQLTQEIDMFLGN